MNNGFPQRRLFHLDLKGSPRFNQNFRGEQPGNFDVGVFSIVVATRKKGNRSPVGFPVSFLTS